MAAFKTFKHKLTGEVKTLPAQYAALFPDVLTEVDPREAHCTDCGVQPVEETPAPEVEEVPTFKEPEPRRKSVLRRNDAVE